MIVALAAPRIATSLDDGVDKVRRLAGEAAARGASVVCFPEAYLPGLRGVDIDVLPFGARDEQHIHEAAAEIARAHRIALILGSERLTEAGRLNVALVYDARGKLLGCQTKNQLAPSEDPFYVPGSTRQMFEIDGLRFGIAICHEGWRYPETVHWAAVRGAQVVFHPQHTGSDREGVRPGAWGAADGPYFEKAMVCRAVENAIYFASVNYALQCPESATSLIDPAGRCQRYLPYGDEGVLVEALNLEQATGLYAGRFAPERYE
jgi:predicted amidohydrolase